MIHPNKVVMNKEKEIEKERTMESWKQLFKHPSLAMVIMQLSYAAMSIISKYALNQGMSPHVLVAYRLAVSSVLITPFAVILERNSRPKMTLTIFGKIVLISLLEPTLDQNLFYIGMKYTTATFTTAMCNILPALTFALAYIFRLEKVDIRKMHSQAKVVGTVVSVAGAMIMTLIKGRVLELPWTNHHSGQFAASGAHKQDYLRGTLALILGCCSWSCYIIFQAHILESYPTKLSLTALICLMGTAESTILALVVERHNSSAWAIEVDSKFLAYIYGGMVTAFALYVMGLVTKKRGPVFVSAFNPLGMVIVTILGSFFLAENLYLARVMGSVVIVFGLYMVLWGKSKDKPQARMDTSAGVDKELATKNLDIERQ